MVRKSLAVLLAIAVLLSLLPAWSVPFATAESPSAGEPASTVSRPPDQEDKSKPDPDAFLRVIIQLEDDPLATYKGGKPGLKATSPRATGARKLDVEKAESKAYKDFLKEQRKEFIGNLKAASPEARVDHEYDVVLNGVAAKVRAGQLPSIRALPGVKAVAVEREFKLTMDAGLGLIGLGTGTLGEPGWADSGLWQALGGHDNAGSRMKIADIDSGLTFDNPCFDPTGYTYGGAYEYDPGFGSYVNAKVVAARAYFRADDPPVFGNTPEDDPGNYGGGHGTHTAGTAACNYATETTYGVKISGVAPKAHLMIYRAFYLGANSWSNVAYDPELILAIDDAVADGADVVNNSWSGNAVYPAADDPLVQAYEAAVEAGVVVVFAAGNAGPGASTIGSPGIGSEFITVGASSTARVFGNRLDVTAPAGSGLSGIASVSGDGPTISTALAGRYVSASPVTGCSSYPPSTFSGRIALVQGGGCSYLTKVTNASSAGAIGVVVTNDSAGPPMRMTGLSEASVPAVMVGQADGSNLANWYSANPGTASLEIAVGLQRIDNVELQDAIASFSARGPTRDLELKPDLVAPGVHTLSAYSPNWTSNWPSGDEVFDLSSGTSMAAPHVAGAAALLRQLNSDWSPAQVKSALMNTAAEPVSLGDYPLDRGAGRLDLTNADDPGVTLEPAGLSFGARAAGGGGSVPVTVTVTDVAGSGGTYAVTVDSASGSVEPTVTPGSVVVPAEGTATFTVTMPTSTVAEDVYGKIVLTPSGGGPVLHVPYWGRFRFYVYLPLVIR